MPGINKYNACVLLAAIVMPLGAGQERRPAGPRISVNLSSLTRTTKRPATIALAGSRVTVTVAGKPKAECLWQFGYQDTALAQKRLRLDAKGAGRFVLVLPGVRSRAECRLMLISDGKKVSRRLIIFPSKMLAGSAKLIKAARFAVIDDDGGIQKAFKTEKVVFEDLSSQLLQDSFDGGAVFLAGFENTLLLDVACRRLRGRIEGGMFVVIVNPPENWRAWGISRQRLSVPLKGAAAFAGNFGQVVRPTDLGSGPWRSVLRRERTWTIPAWVTDLGAGLWWSVLRGAGPCSVLTCDGDLGGGLRRLVRYVANPWRALAWIGEDSKDNAGKPRSVRHSLIAVRRIGRGCVIVVLLPQMADPLADAVGRGVLDELVLWVLRQHIGGYSGKE